MNRRYEYSPRHPSEPIGHRFVAPAAFLGSLIAITLMLYAIDVSPLRTLLLTQ